MKTRGARARDFGVWLPEDFRDVLVELADAQAEFVLIGGPPTLGPLTLG